MNKKIELGEAEIAYGEWGEGEPPLVLVHGFTGASIDFDDHHEELAASRRVLSPDNRGHGDSTNFGRRDAYTLDLLAADTIAFLEAVAGADTAPVDLLGHSMGGMIALRVVLSRPELVRSLVLMDTAAESLGGDGSVPDGVEALVKAVGLLEMHRKMPQLPESAAFREQRGQEWVAANQEARLSRMDPEAFLGLMGEVFGGPSLVDRLGEIRCPTLVIVGTQDVPFLAPSQRLAEAIPGAQLAAIEGAWHSPQRTHGEEWRRFLLAHLDSVAS